MSIVRESASLMLFATQEEVQESKFTQVLTADFIQGGLIGFRN